MASDKIQTLTDTSFEQSVEKAPAPVLVDFWAEWCAPCRRLEPTVDALALEFEGRMSFGKLNVDENPMTPMRFGIQGIPTLLLFKGGRIVESVVGLVGKDELKRILEKYV